MRGNTRAQGRRDRHPLVSSIQPGVDNKASVTKLLGSPTFTGQFTPNDWYYVSRDTSQFAFRNPRVSKQTVLHVIFDGAGNVTSIQKSGKELVLNLDPARSGHRRLAANAASSKSCSGNRLGQLGRSAVRWRRQPVTPTGQALPRRATFP